MKYPAYPEYRATSNTALPLLPDHWQIKRLRFATTGIEQGWSPQCDNEVADDDRWGVMKVGCVNGDQFDPLENKALPAMLDPIPAYELQPGDVLVSRANTKELVGSAAVVPEGVRPRLLLCDKLFRIRPQDEVQARFLTYVLRTPAARHHYERDATGASGSMQNIGQDTLKNLCIPLPSGDEQTEITAFLDWRTAQIDALIAKKQTLIDRLREQRQSLIAHHVTQGLSPQTPTRETAIPWLQRIPAHWDTIPLGFLTTMSGGMTPSMSNPEYWDGDVPWVTPKDMKQAEVWDATDHVTDLALSETGLSLVPPGATLIVVRGMILAHSFPAAMVRAPVTINQDMKALRCTDRLDSDYLFWCLNGFADVLINLAQESAHGTKKMESETIKKFVLPVPPLDEQQNIAKQLGKALQKIDQSNRLATEAIDRLTEYRSALITAAVTGQIDVRGVKVPAPV